MTSILLEDKSIENFEKALHSLEENSQAVIILACDENHLSKEALDPILKRSSLTIIGGIFPAIIYNNIQYNQGTILLGLDNGFTVHTIRHISQAQEYDSVVEETVGELACDTKTMFLFFDGISQNIDTIIQSIFNNYGLTINYIGGSAAGRDFQKKPILFSNEGLLEDAALIATTTVESTIGVKHGWESLSEETYQVTRAKGNCIYEIDYKPALEVYKKILQKHTDHILSQENHFSIARSFPLGINRLSGDSIVRVANGTTEDGALTCTGDVPENSSIQILHATNRQLIEAAAEASVASDAIEYKKSFKLYIGCLARLLVLEEDFYKELNAIYKEGELLVGALSVGEVANNQDHYLELYNSTAVVAKVADA